MKGFIILLLLFSYSASSQFLENIAVSRGALAMSGGVGQLEILDSTIYTGCGSVSRFYFPNGGTSIANFFSFSGNDQGFINFAHQPQTRIGLLNYHPGFGYLLFNIFTIPYNDSLMTDFYDTNGNLLWSRSGVEKIMVPIGVTNDSFALGSNVYSDVAPLPHGLVSLDLRQGDVKTLSYEVISDSLERRYPGLGAFIGNTQGGLVDSSNIAHFVIRLYRKTDLKFFSFLYLSVDKDLNIVSADTAAINNAYYRFDRNYYYKIIENYDSLTQIANMTIDVYSSTKTFVHQFSIQQTNMPERHISSPVVNYHHGHLAIANRIVVSTAVGYGYYPRFQLIDTTGNVIYDHTLELDTIPQSRLVTEHLRLDDSLNLYFVASYADRISWYLGKITANGDIVNPLARPSEPLSNRFSVYPNPFSDVLRVDLLEKGNFTFKLYNLLGAKILERDFVDEMQQTISTDYLKPGLYIYIMEGQDGTVYRGEVLKV